MSDVKLVRFDIKLELEIMTKVSQKMVPVACQSGGSLASVMKSMEDRDATYQSTLNNLSKKLSSEYPDVYAEAKNVIACSFSLLRRYIMRLSTYISTYPSLPSIPL